MDLTLMSLFIVISGGIYFCTMNQTPMADYCNQVTLFFSDFVKR
jgi:hypothetical protein